jgi:hypothetical protein
MADDKIPTYTVEESTESIFPGVGDDVPAPEQDSINAGAIELARQNAKGSDADTPYDRRA